MITKKRQCLSWRPLCLLLAVALCGCSIIGLTIGALSDARQPKAMTVPGWKVDTLKVGAKVEVLLRDGRTVNGKFKGIKPMPFNQYVTLHNEAKAQLPEGMYLPNPTDTLVMTFAARKPQESEVTVTGQLAGFVRDSVRVGQNVAGKARIVAWPLSELIRLSDQRGNELTGETIRSLINDGKIPVRSSLAILAKSEQKLIPTNQVQQVHQLAGKKEGVLVGFLLGAAIDAAVIAAVASADWGSFMSTNESGSMSCPFVYSFDGRQYVLDSETFGGAIFRAAQRTDLDNLDHLTEVNGSYRMKITNELPETQFVDELRLLVVDHPRDTRVVPSFSGKINTLAAPQPPNKATSYRGDEVQNLIIDKDNRVWVSNPFGRNPEDKSQARDGLLLEFPRPAGYKGR